MDLAACIDLIRARSARAGLQPSDAIATELARYVDLLARWNRKINLTALGIDPPDEAAIDRLIVEPLVGAKRLTADDRVVMDIGSGGGSPAIPMKIAAPRCRFVLVEVKERKSAFLREAIRQLALADAEVRTARAEDLPAPPSPEATADVITIRAVRMDQAMAEAIRRQLSPRGRLLWFQGQDADRATVPSGFEVVDGLDLVPGADSRLVVATPTTSNC